VTLDNKQLSRILFKLATLLGNCLHTLISYLSCHLLFGLELLRLSRSTQCPETESGVHT